MIRLEGNSFAPIENIDNIFLKDFIKSLTKVHDKYLIWPYGRNTQMSERVFAYEFYHQWRLIGHTPDYDNLLLNAEIRKDGSIFNHENFGIKYPDLVLHQQQNNMNRQLIVCEIKTAKNIDSSNGKFQLKKDLLKLANYINVLHFEIAVFIQVKNEFSEFEKVKKYLKKKESEFTNTDKIYYFIKEANYIEFDTLANILDNDIT